MRRPGLLGGLGAWVTRGASAVMRLMCAVRPCTESFERPYLERITDHFGGMVIHHHSLGRHIHAELAKLPEVFFLQIATDHPGGLEPIHQIEAIYGGIEGTPLQLHCSAQDVFRYIDVLETGQAIIMATVDSVEEAHAVIELVRKNSKI